MELKPPRVHIKRYPNSQKSPILSSNLMCKTKMAIDASEPISNSSRRSHKRPSKQPQQSQSSPPDNSSSNHISYISNSGSGSGYRLNSSIATTSVSSQTSLSSLKLSLPDNPQVYDFSDIRAATNNFLAKRYSSSTSSSWRCNLKGKDVIIFQRRMNTIMDKSDLRSKLSVICRSHFRSVIKLLGASMSYSNDQIYLIYEYVPGSNLSICLRNPRNPSFTVLSTWMSRMQIATDVAHGLEYIHNNNNTGSVHKFVKSSGIIVTEPDFNAKICHFGAAELCKGNGDETTGEFEGVNGYMSPEFQSTGVATQKSDVYAFGVVLLELFSGEEPVRYKYDRATASYRKICAIQTAREAAECGGGAAEDGGGARLRKWMDRRLRDSFPLDVAEKGVRLALECVHAAPDDRPDMRRVAGKISKLYLESKFWSERVKMPTEISVSLAPR